MEEFFGEISYFGLAGDFAISSDFSSRWRFVRILCLKIRLKLGNLIFLISKDLEIKTKKILRYFICRSPCDFSTPIYGRILAINISKAFRVQCAKLSASAYIFCCEF